MSLTILSLFVYAVLLVPIVVIVLTSLTPRPFPTLPREGISLQWYVTLLNDPEILNALSTSIFVATISSILSGLLGTITAFGFVRTEFPYKEQISTLMLLPLMISPVITGLALIQYASELGISSGYVPVVLGHTILTLPYVFLIVRAELVSFDTTLEAASQVLGAGPAESILNVTLPIISPAVFSAILISFVVSFGEFTATQFLVSPGTTTVPVIIYTMTRSGLSPVISALSTVLIVVMLIVAVLATVLER
ncbi:ABC transporter permease [Halomarina halobia]|uniref:ABC transporter permease n=1 Tax=Halomarina halobia TaxID=3033386 RepID=A0ABD6AGI2_9EURY|nr:ABC transporter permease [Halomarina sp. PSR21]